MNAIEREIAILVEEQIGSQFDHDAALLSADFGCAWSYRLPSLVHHGADAAQLFEVFLDSAVDPWSAAHL